MQFSLKRIWLLTGKQWTENRNLYLFGLLALIGVILCVSVFTLSTPYGFNHENQQVTFFIGMLLSGGIFTTRILSQFTERSKAIAALTLPASTLEKLTVAILYTYVIFPLVYFITIYPVLILVHYIDVEIAGNFNLLYNFKSGTQGGSWMIGYYLALQTLVLLFSVLFRRFAFLKTAILIITLFFLMRFANQTIAEMVFKLDEKSMINAHIKNVSIYREANKIVEGKLTTRWIHTTEIYASPYTAAQIQNDFMYLKLEISGAYRVLFYTLLLLTMPFLWMITWFRLKETEL